MRPTTVLLLMMATLAPAAVGQRGAPVVALTTGLGEPFGGIGLQGEVLIANGRLAFIGGAGTMPGPHYLRASITGTAGLRYYFVTAQRHRFFTGASWSLLRTYDLLMPGVPTVYQYGPGLLAGYSFLSKVGLTFTVGGGVGRTRHDTIPVGEVGIGWTWRRSS